MSNKRIGVAGTVVIILIVAGIALLGGGDDDAQATETDGAFIAGMVPHHESAIEMAEIARERAEHPEISQLADDIIATQSEEIATLTSIHERLFSAPVGDVDHGTLGLAEHEMGMEGDTTALETAKPFDRAFIDMMIPHHQGAIRMARIELDAGEDEETMALAEAIIAAQSAEIEEMNEWRSDWYGEPSPAGGVPAADDTSTPAHEEMGH